MPAENHKKRILKLIGAYLLVVLIVACIYLFFNKSSDIKVERKPGDNGQSKLTSPKINFKSYKVDAVVPTFPQLATKYHYNTENLNRNIYSVAETLGLNQSNVKEDVIILFNSDDAQDRGMLAFNQKTGEVFFQSFGLHLIADDSATYEDQALKVLETLGIADSTVSCPISYNRRSYQNLIFVECHRDWENVGLPIYNPVGIINIEESTPLNSLKLGYLSDDSYKDSEIINTTTGQDGLRRPTDFNSATIAISTIDRRIVYLKSNIKPVLEQELYDQSGLISPQEAIESFKSNKSIFSLTIPAGEGLVDWNILYPSGIAESKEAVVTDFSLAYLDGFSQNSEKTLEPMYLIRGSAVLSSGYRIRFVQAIPAIKANNLTNESVLGESTYLSQKTIKLDTFTPTPEVKITPSTNNTTSTPSATPIDSTNVSPSPTEPRDLTDCAEALKDLPSFTINVPKSIYYPEGGDLTLVKTDRRTVYFKSSTFDITMTREVLDILAQLIREQFMIYTARYLVDNPDKLAEIKASENPGAKIVEIASDIDKLNILEAMETSVGGTRYTILMGERIMYFIENDKLSEQASKSDVLPQDLLFNEGADSDVWSPGNWAPIFCFVTGASPSIYYYGSNFSSIKILPQFDPTYSDPALDNGNIWDEPVGSSLWDVPDGTSLWDISLFNFHRRLYYEYDYRKVKYSDSKSGFVSSWDNWRNEVINIASQLNLTDKEKEDLIIDVGNQLSNNERLSYLKISLIEKNELDRELPIKIQSVSNVNFQRLHLMLTPLDKYINIPKPILAPILRDGDLLLEIGVFFNKNTLY